MRVRVIAAAAFWGAASLAPAQTAEELIAKNIAARGGIENIKAVQTMRLTGTMKTGDDTLPSVLELKRPNKSRWEFTLDGQTAVQAFDGTDGWTWIPFAGQAEPRSMSDEERKEAAQQADIDGPLVDYAQKGSRIELVPRDRDYRPDDWKLKVTLKSGEVRFIYLDPRTFLQSASVLTRQVDGRSMEVRSEVGDYRREGSLMLPHSFSASTKDGAPAQSLQFSRIELNVPIDDARFRMPPPKRPAQRPDTAPTPIIG